MRKFYIVFIVIVAAALGLTYLFQAGFQPLALVNSKLVWYRQFEKEYQSALKYYNQTIETYKLPGLNEDEIKKVRLDVKLATLDRIIEKIIISDGFRNLAGNGGEALIAQKIDKYLSDVKLEAAAAALFNLEIEEFKNLILIPQAERELLVEKLTAESRDFNSWLDSQKKQAKVYLFTKEFEWTGEGIKRR